MYAYLLDPCGWMRATAVHAARKSSNPKPVETWLRTFRQKYSRIMGRNREEKKLTVFP